MAHAFAPPRPVPDRGHWIPDDLDDLPEGARYEIVDGALLVSPMPDSWHQLVVAEIVAQLQPQLPPELVVLPGMDVVIGRSMRAPDALVVPRALVRQRVKRLAPADVVLAIETESPSSISQDRVLKPREYAAAGIEGYWRIVLEPLTIVAQELRDGGYAVVDRGDRISVERPFPCSVDLHGLFD